MKALHYLPHLMMRLLKFYSTNIRNRFYIHKLVKLIKAYLTYLLN